VKEHELTENKKSISAETRQALGRRALFLMEIGKFLAFFGEPLQQRSRLPKFAMLLVKFFNAIVNLVETNGVGVPHWSAAAGKP
jgi:hypothetical protein